MNISRILSWSISEYIIHEWHVHTTQICLSGIKLVDFLKFLLLDTLFQLKILIS